MLARSSPLLATLQLSAAAAAAGLGLEACLSGGSSLLTKVNIHELNCICALPPGFAACNTT